MENQPTPASKKYIVFCDYCSTKKVITDKTQHGLTPYTLASVPGVKGKTFDRPPMVKCPTCGRGVSMKKVIYKDSKHNEPDDPNDPKTKRKDEFDGRETGIIGLPV